MPVANCKRCGRIFNKVRRDICMQCIAEENKAFEVVRAYLKDHKDATMGDVVEATGVELELIVSMIQDGRLILRDNPNIYYDCERCGGPTQSGRLCAKCTKELAEEMTGAANALRQRMMAQQKDRRGERYWSK